MTTRWRRRRAAGALAGTVGGVAAAAFPAPAPAQGRTRWRMVTTWPRGFPGPGTGAERFARSVAEASDGRLTIEVLPAGEPVPAFEAFRAVTDGTADLMHASPVYWQDRMPAVVFFAAVPFGMTTGELQAWLRHGGGQELMDELYDGFGLKPFPAGSTGVQMGGWTNREIRATADLEGLRMRMPGLGGEMMRRLGAEIVSLPAGEIVRALKAGALDAAEWIGPWNDLALGLHEVAQHYYWPGVHEPASELEITVGKRQLTSLPGDLRALFEACCRAEAATLTAEFNARNGAALTTLIRRHGVQLKRMPDEVLVAMGTAAGQVIAERRDSGDAATRRVAQSFLSARAELKAWTTIGEYAFTRARGLDYRYA